MNNSQKGFALLILLLIAAGVLVLGGAGYWYYQNQNKAPELIGGQKDVHGCLIPAGYSWCEVKQKCLRVWEEKCEATSTTQTSDSPTADWKTYTNSQYGFEIKYPKYWIFSEQSTGGNDITISFKSNEKIQDGCGIDLRADVGMNPFLCPGNGFDISIFRDLTRDKYIAGFKGSKLMISKTEDVVISGITFTKVIFTNDNVQYITETNGYLLSFSSIGYYDRTERIILSTFKFNP